MAKGIIYVMETCVEGLVKIGKTGSDNFEQRMSLIERDGYHRISVLRRNFAIEVEDYDEKEKLLHEIFGKSRVGDSELFAIDINLVRQLMASMDGKQIYPKDETKEEVFEQATEEIQIKEGILPEGIYTLDSTVKADKTKIHAEMEVKNGQIILKKGSIIATQIQFYSYGWSQVRQSMKVEGSKSVEDVICKSPSMAASIVCGHNMNGWVIWKDSDGNLIDKYRVIDKD